MKLFICTQMAVPPCFVAVINVNNKEDLTDQGLCLCMVGIDLNGEETIRIKSSIKGVLNPGHYKSWYYVTASAITGAQHGRN